MRNIHQERPQPIRVLLLHPMGSSIEQSLTLFFNDQTRGFPIQLIGTTNSPERCRSLIRELFPDVVMLADVGDESAWHSTMLQLSKDINIDFQTVATVILTDSSDMENYFTQAISAGARGVVKVERLGDGVLGTLGGEVERSILQAFEFIRRKKNEISELADARIKTIALLSGKGGVGKSTLASAIAGEIARRQPTDRVALIDFDVQFGAIAPMLGLRPSNTLATLAPHTGDVRSSTDITDFMTVHSVGEGINIHVLPAPPSPMDLSVLHPESAAEMLSTLRRRFDTVVVDLPTQLTDASLATFQIADLLLLVCEPEMLSVRSCRQLIELLTKDPTIGKPSATVKVVLNKVKPKSLIQADDLTRLFADRVIAKLSYEPEFVNEHISRGRLIGSIKVKNQFLAQLRSLYHKLELQPLDQRADLEDAAQGKAERGKMSRGKISQDKISRKKAARDKSSTDKPRKNGVNSAAQKPSTQKDPTKKPSKQSRKAAKPRRSILSRLSL